MNSGCKMKSINNYCGAARKKTERLLKKVFGCGSIRKALKERKSLETSLEFFTGKKIDSFTVEDVKSYRYQYARYKTLDKILSVYFDLVVLDKFICKEFGNEHSKGSGN